MTVADGWTKGAPPAEVLRVAGVELLRYRNPNHARMTPLWWEAPALTFVTVTTRPTTPEALGHVLGWRNP